VKKVRVVRDQEEAGSLWKNLMPTEVVTNLWEVRLCFHRHFRRPIHFIVQEEGGNATTFLPLSWVEESGCYAVFPGETWQGRTWLEQNLIVGEDAIRLLETIPGPYDIRYLSPRCIPDNSSQCTVDEVGYLFVPGMYGFDFGNYFDSFSGKSRKRLRNEIRSIEARGMDWRYGHLEDINAMVSMNLLRYGPDSYFSDPRFKRGFSEMLNFFADHGWLHVTTALVEGQVSAVDVGVLYNGTYTLLAGGTNPFFPGIAKVMNTHHIRRACLERMREIDFLCGDFNWKKMFHLKERPLFLAGNAAVRAA